MPKNKRRGRTAKCSASVDAKKLPDPAFSPQTAAEDPEFAGEEGTGAPTDAKAPFQLPKQRWRPQSEAWISQRKLLVLISTVKTPKQEFKRQSEQWISQRKRLVLVSTVKTLKQEFRRQSTPEVVTASRLDVTVNVFVRRRS